MFHFLKQNVYLKITLLGQKTTKKEQCFLKSTALDIIDRTFTPITTLLSDHEPCHWHWRHLFQMSQP